MNNHDAKLFLKRRGFPCFHGETLTYIEIAHIFKNKKINEGPEKPDFEAMGYCSTCGNRPCDCDLNKCKEI